MNAAVDTKLLIGNGVIYIYIIYIYIYKIYKIYIYIYIYYPGYLRFEDSRMG